MMRKQSLLALVTIFCLAFVYGTWAFAEEPAVDYHLDSHHIPAKNGTPETTITVETAEPDPDAANPNDPNGGNKTGNPSAHPGDASNNGGNSPGGGTSPGGTRQDGKTNSPQAANPEANPQTGTQSPGTNSTSETNSPGTGSPDANPSGEPAPGNANPSSANPGSTNPGDAHPGDAKPGEAKPNKPKTPWYESLWNKAKQAGKGALAGAIGAGIVIGIVVVGALVLGAAISAPLLLTALAVGVLAGVVYGLMAGDQFSWIKGIGIGGMAALAVITIGELGVGAALRGAIQVVRSAGMRGALRAAGSRSLGLLRGAFGGLQSFVRGLGSAPLQTLKKAVFNKVFGVTFGTNLGANYLGHLAFTGKVPGVGDTAKILAESFVSTLILNRAFKFRLPTGKSALGTGKVGDFTKVKNLKDFRSRIPKHADQLPWKKIPGGAEKGVKYRWTDTNGDVYNVRAHSPDPSAPPGSNAAEGWIYRVEVRFGGQGKTYFMDSSGNFHPQNVMKPTSPMYNEAIANDTHIPFAK